MPGGAGMSDVAVNWAFDECPDVQGGALVVLLTLARDADDRGVVAAMPVAEIARLARLSTRMTQYHLRLLEQDGYLGKFPGNGRGHKSGFRLGMRKGAKGAKGAADFTLPDDETVQPAAPFPTQRVQSVALHDGERVQRAQSVAPFSETRISSPSQVTDISKENSPERAARTRACEEFTPSRRLVEELINRGFPPEEFDGLMADYRRKRATDNDPLTDANFRKYALWYMRETLHIPDHGDLTVTRVGPKTADKLQAFGPWLQDGRRR